jgi:hypothetical protein
MTRSRVASPWAAAVWMFAALGGVSPGLIAQAGRDTTAAPPAAGSGQLAGRVIETTATSQPVRRAIVTLVGPSLPAGRSAITDDDGHFRFDRVPSGIFTLSATRAGYIPATYGAARPGRPGTPIRVGDGQRLADVTLAMAHGSALEGTLRDSAADVAPGMRVEAIRLIGGAGAEHGETAGTAYTDDRGVFRIFGLSAGTYVLAATPALIIGGMGDIGAPTEADIDALLAAIQRRSTSLPPPGNPAPAPLPPTKGYSTPATFYPGVFQAGEATPITLGPNDERTGLDFEMRLSHAAAIDGLVVPIRGQSVPTLQISIQGSGPELPVAGGSMGNGPSLSTNPTAHTFRFSNAAPGHYRIWARSLGAPGSPTSVIASGGALPPVGPSGGVQWAVAEVDIGGDDVSGVTLALQPALRVTGRLVFDGTAQRPPADLSSVRLALEPVATDETGAALLTAPIAGTVNQDGTVEFPAVIPGSFRLRASAGGTWWLRSALVEAHDVLDGGLTVGQTDLAGVVLTLSDRHTAITGTLSGIEGRPAPDYFLVAFSTDRAQWRAPSRRILSTRPATDGSFELRDLAPGAYYLAALTDVMPTDLDDPAFLESLVTASLTLTVDEGQRLRQDIKIGGRVAPELR